MSKRKKMGKQTTGLDCGAYVAPPTEKNYNSYNLGELSIRDLIVAVLNSTDHTKIDTVRAYYVDNKGSQNDGLNIFNLPSATLYDNDFVEPFKLSEVIYRFDIKDSTGNIVESGCVKSNNQYAFYKLALPSGSYSIEWVDFPEVTREVLFSV